MAMLVVGCACGQNKGPPRRLVWRGRGSAPLSSCRWPVPHPWKKHSPTNIIPCSPDSRFLLDCHTQSLSGYILFCSLIGCAFHTMAVEPAAAVAAPSLPYHEPGIVTILIQTAFLLLLNVVNSVLDRLVYCGLLGQVLIGIAWGTPGAKWLSIESEQVIVQLGYLGLILLVYEGTLRASCGLIASFLICMNADRSRRTLDIVQIA